MVHHCSAAHWLKITRTPTYDRVNIAQRLVGTIGLIQFFFFYRLNSHQRGVKNVLHGAIRCLEKGDACFPLGANENLATEK